MTVLQEMRDLMEGLEKDPSTGDYRVMPGYGQQALRYRINETYLDEDDNLFVSAEAVERMQTEEEQGHAESR